MVIHKALMDWYQGKTYGEIWGYRTDRLYQKSDFEYDANGNLQFITLTADESAKYAGKKVYKLTTVNGKPVYQPFLQNSSNFFFGPGDVKFVDLNGDGDINEGSRLLDDHGDLEVIGNSTLHVLNTVYVLAQTGTVLTCQYSCKALEAVRFGVTDS